MYIGMGVYTMKMEPIFNWLVAERPSDFRADAPVSKRQYPDNPPRMAALAMIGLLNAALWVVLIWALSPAIQVATNGVFEPSPLFSDRTLWVLLIVWPASIIGLALTGMTGNRTTA